MSFAIPRNNDSDLLLYIWRIIEAPSIDISDLIYLLSFKLYIFLPDEAHLFIDRMISGAFLLKETSKLSISSQIKEKLEKWQIEQKRNILKKIDAFQQVKEIYDGKDNNEAISFSSLINSLTEKSTLGRTASVQEESFENLEEIFSKDIIKTSVLGSKQEKYVIIIDFKEHHLYHNCDDFKNRQSKEKKFCKHIAKLFMLFKEKDKKKATDLLKLIAETINSWEFSE